MFATNHGQCKWFSLHHVTPIVTSVIPFMLIMTSVIPFMLIVMSVITFMLIMTSTSFNRTLTFVLALSPLVSTSIMAICLNLIYLVDYI